MFVGSCCIGYLLPDALVFLLSRDTGVEVARWRGCVLGDGGGADGGRPLINT